ncbi:hypothetical protein BT96DRAFT_1006998 [Gymnopus androsaceus JB14]|uniref:Uncharacterized protein n=1 Tax=Gymnopus androsaceus JB14 TaxID=1447944 RepID=A0A6A4GJC8_9AGAR|nr:hypothetical protein BT96DRAFT_1006998 [Gymnopus androsaceus JB14]
MVKKTNQFIDLKAQVDSDKELSNDEDLIDSDFIDNLHGEARDPLPPTSSAPFPSSSSTSLTAAPSPCPLFLLQLVGQIQCKYIKKSFPKAGHN